MVVGPIAEASAMQIFAKSEDNKTLILEVEQAYTLDQVKSQIQDRLGIPSVRQRLYFFGVPLDDGKTLSDCNIVKESTLHVVIKRLPPKIWLATPTKLKGKVWLHFRAYPDGPALKVKSVVAKIDGKTVWSGRARSAGRFPYAVSKPGRHTLTLTVTDSGGRKATKSVSFTTG